MTSEGPDEPEGPPSHHDELARWSHEAGPQYGRKLTHSEKCGIAWALHQRMKRGHETVARAFNLSRATVSQLARALDPHSKRYRDVYEAYYTLGAELFAERYYTRELHFRLRRVMLELTHLSDSRDIEPKPKGPDPRAAKYAGVHILPDNSQWEIALSEHGWRFRALDSETWHGAERLRGLVNFEPFTHSSDAFDAIYELNGYESPRPKPGRPRK